MHQLYKEHTSKQLVHAPSLPDDMAEIHTHIDKDTHFTSLQVSPDHMAILNEMQPSWMENSSAVRAMLTCSQLGVSQSPIEKLATSVNTIKHMTFNIL